LRFGKDGEKMKRKYWCLEITCWKIVAH